MRIDFRTCFAGVQLLAVGILPALADSPGDVQPVVAQGLPPQAPPTAPPIEFRAPTAAPPARRPHGPTGTLYSIGQPTDEEQLYLEYLNRARANPPEEGTRLANTTDPDVLSAYIFFNVDLAAMQSQFNLIAPAPPLAMNAQLMTAARLHSGDMFTNQYQGHFETNGATVLDPGDRITNQNYNWSTYGENVFSYSKSVFYGHAGFEVDWGNGPGGMQSPPGHRNNIHNSNFREVGVGVVDASNGPVGPQLVTQDLATQQGATPLITGVVHYDFNTNSFYDVDEGIGGVTVTVSGANYYAETADSGGYAVPVPGNGSYTVTFTANGLPTNQQTVVVSSSHNVKVDYVPVYSPPIISGPDPAGVNQTNIYTFSPVGGATSYQWEQTRVAPFNVVEGAESGLTDFTTSTSAGYNVIATSPAEPVASGSHSFHLAHPSPAADQVLTLTRVFLPGSNSQMQFMSRLGVASSNQIARVQVSADQGISWNDVYAQPGDYPAGQEFAFAPRTVSLANYAGSAILLRFVYDYQGGNYYVGASTGTGWYIDDISFGDTEELTNSAIADIPSGMSFIFQPSVVGDYLLRVRARISNRILSFGPAKRVTASNILPISVQFSSSPSVSGNQVQIDFDVSNFRAGTVFQLLKAGNPAGPWNPDGAASIQPVAPNTNTNFRATTTTGGAAQTFYQIEAN